MSEASYSTMSSHTFQERLAQGDGALLLEYIGSEEFGQHGESQKFFSLYQEFIERCEKENKELERQNK